jgi:hypothetical protein
MRFLSLAGIINQHEPAFGESGPAVAGVAAIADITGLPG